jgi:hypothetical protein
MDPLQMHLIAVSQLWHAVPLIVAISLVYAGTRHELARPIMEHAVRLGMWITSFMGVVAAILFVISWWL